MKWREFLGEFYVPILLCIGTLTNVNLVADWNIGGIRNNISFSDIGIFACLVGYACLFYSDLRPKLYARRWQVFIISIFTLTILAGSLINNPHWLISLKTFVRVYLLFFVVLFLFKTSTLTHRAIIALCITISLVNVIGLAEFFLYKNIAMIHLLSFFRSPESMAVSGEYVSSILPYCNLYGVLNAIVLGILMPSLTIHNQKHNNPLLWLTTILCITGVILSCSRNGALTLTAEATGLLILILYRPNTRKYGITILAIFVTILGLNLRYNQTYSNKLGLLIPVAKTLYHHKSPPTNTSMIIDTNTPGATERYQVWKTGLKYWQGKPILGNGISSTRYWLDFQSPHYNMHNTYLEILVTNGIIGLVFFIGLILAWAAAIKQCWHWIPFAGLLVSFIFDAFLDLTPIWIIFIAWLAALTTTKPANLSTDSN